jgi:rod shape-determining protein MreD
MMALLLMAISTLAALLQLSAPLAWWPLDLPLLVTAYAGLTRGRGWGLLCGLLAGLWLDALHSPLPGLRMVPLALAGALADALQPGTNREQPRLQVAVVILLVLLHDLGLALLARAQHLHQGGLGRFVLSYGLPRLAAQALATVPLFWVLGLLVKQKAFLDPRQRDVQTIRRWP